VRLIDVSTPKFPNTFAKVDDEDYERLAKFKWSAYGAGRTWYALRPIERDGKKTTIGMHQEVLPGLRLIDHINRDGLDNRRENLRPCTPAQNAWNATKTRGSSRFKGVAWHKSAKKWRAEIMAQGIYRYLGCFDCEGCAAIAYDNAARELFGEFACPNFYAPTYDHIAT